MAYKVASNGFTIILHKGRISMISLLPFVLSLAFAFGGGPVNGDLGHDAFRRDNTDITIRSEEVDPPPPCTTICRGPEDVEF
jgi:hypothetical protein